MNTTYRTRAALPTHLPADILAILESLRLAWLALNAEPAGIHRLAVSAPGTAYHHCEQAFIRTLAAVPGVTIEDAERIKEATAENGENAEWNWGLLRDGAITSAGPELIEVRITALLDDIDALSLDGNDEEIAAVQRQLDEASEIQARLIREHRATTTP